jgi:hypothetical protein
MRLPMLGLFAPEFSGRVQTADQIRAFVHLPANDDLVCIPNRHLQIHARNRLEHVPRVVESGRRRLG